MPKVHIMDHEMNFCLSPTSVLNYYAETFAFHSSVTKGSRLSTVTTMKGFSVFFFKKMLPCIIKNIYTRQKVLVICHKML